MAAVLKDDEYNEICGETTFLKITEGNVDFLTHAKSYYHWGPAFVNHSQLEFECIVQLQNKAVLTKNMTKIVALNQDLVSHLD